MKKILAFVTALLMTMSFAAAEQVDHGLTIPFNANPTTGYEWTAFVAGGTSVTLDDANGSYTSDPNPDMLDGVGGTTYFTLKPVEPGESIVIFTYARGWENDIAQQVVILASVDEDLNLYTSDVTEGGVHQGIVNGVNTEDHSVTLLTDTMGEVIARFPEGMSLPVMGETITIYTNGIMTMSLPAIVNVISWSSIPGADARVD